MTVSNVDRLDSRIKSSLSNIKNKTLIILRGHLIAEEIINENLRYFFKKTKNFEKLKLSFHQRFNILSALSGMDGHLYESVIKLNTLRNNIAHKIDSDEPTQRSLNDFLKHFDADDSIPDQAIIPVEIRLKRCIAFTCGQLSGFKSAHSAILGRRDQ